MSWHTERVAEIHRKYDVEPHAVYRMATDAEKVILLEALVLEAVEMLSRIYSDAGSMSIRFGGIGGNILRSRKETS